MRATCQMFSVSSQMEFLETDIAVSRLADLSDALFHSCQTAIPIVVTN